MTSAAPAIFVTAFALLSLVLREAVLAHLTRRSALRFRRIYQDERTRRLFAEIRNDLLELTFRGEADPHSRTFRALHHVTTFIMRRPQKYPQIASMLMHTSISPDAVDSGLLNEFKTTTPELRQLLRRTAEALEYVIQNYSRLYRVLAWGERKFGAATMALRIIHWLQDRADERNPDAATINRSKNMILAQLP